MHEFWKTKIIIIWDIAKYKANILIHLKKILDSEDKAPAAETRRGKMPFNDCECYC